MRLETIKNGFYDFGQEINTAEYLICNVLICR